MRTQALALAAVAIAALSSLGSAQDARMRKKLIETGWDQPDTERLLANLAEMEKRPFDGVVIAVVGRVDEKKRCDLRETFAATAWQREWFQPCVADLRACKFKRFTDNFIVLGANPGNVDWFDDAGWRAIVEHWRIAAWVAKQGGVKGFLFDPEPYTAPHSQFHYAAQPERDKHSFDEYHAKARERGRQVMQAVAAEYPDITLFCYFMNVVCGTATGHADPRRILAAQGYGLYPAFIDGWLDVIPPTVALVDGCEMAYTYNSVEQYLESAVLIKGACQELVSPENRAKYRAQTQVSFGMYLDAYWNPPKSPWFIDGKGGTRVDRLRANTATALRVADEYVWVYGERFRWWPTPNGGVKKETWPEAIPGSEAALRFARDPLDYARSQIADLTKTGKLANLARNGDFASDKAPSNKGPAEDWKEGRAPAGWHTWQAEKSKGTFTWDREVGYWVEPGQPHTLPRGMSFAPSRPSYGSAKAAGVANGCFIQAHDVKPGERYAVHAVRRLAGKGDAFIRIRWQTAEGKWTAETLDVLIYAEGPREAWAEMLGVAEVPQSAGRLLILLCAMDQPSPADAVWFDGVALYRIE